MSATGERPDAGATLLETLVVLALTVMIGGLLFPSYERAAQRERLEFEAADLRYALGAARAAAVRNGGPVRLEVAADGGAYAWAGAAPHALLPDVRAAVVGADGPPVFFPDGSASGGALVLMAGGRRLAVAAP